MTKEVTTRVKKAAGIVIPTGVIIACVVAILGRSIAAWPGKIDAQLNQHEVRITKVETLQVNTEEDVVDAKGERKEIRLEQKAMRKDMNDGFRELLEELRRDGR